MTAPPSPLHLYAYDACPYCRRVRQAFESMGLTYLSVPCARGAKGRAAVLRAGGKAQFPFFADTATETAFYESADIVDYVREHYGLEEPGRWHKAAAFLSGFGRSQRVAPPELQVPENTPVVFIQEAGDEFRRVRRLLEDLDLMHWVRTTGEGPSPTLELPGQTVHLVGFAAIEAHLTGPQP
ncbi:MAG: hypothetical protein AUK47_00680 [Deltaproteobacteria bacterium CG2_30_63_29]|nr:MAG: hypothetical protein AUK47_00680 [Deltaproteobacteria bacterium CG2_30_63_29]PJB38206.1 MAG: hypothetical protein CO108_19460 [Deltaproteobacteria bacterium CG_4_9_14_3_um_filter_63_12]